VTDAYPLVVIAPLAGLALYCGSHLLVSRRMDRRRPYRPLTIGFLVGFAGAWAVTGGALATMQIARADALALLSLNSLGYLALAFGYFNFVNLNITSLRIRVLHEMREAGGALSRSDLLAHYDSDQMINLRLQRLIEGGHLREAEGRLFIGRHRFLLTARCFQLWRWIIVGKRI
jgi:hypothetical protein